MSLHGTNIGQYDFFPLPNSPYPKHHHHHRGPNLEHPVTYHGLRIHHQLSEGLSKNRLEMVIDISPPQINVFRFVKLQ